MRPGVFRLVVFLAGSAFAIAMSGTPDEAASPLCEAARDECARGGDCNAYMCYCFGGPFCEILG